MGTNRFNGRGFKVLSDYRTKLAGWLNYTAEWISRSQSGTESKSRYVDLAPTDKADPSGIYSGALAEATNNPRVLNIALTGPYGSGKSSIVQSFLKNYRRPALQISLAAFLPDAASKSNEVDKQKGCSVEKQRGEQTGDREKHPAADALWR